MTQPKRAKSLKLHQNNASNEPFEITIEELFSLVTQVEKVDPIDFAGLPIDEKDFLHHVTNSVMNMLNEMEYESPKHWTITLIASLTKTIAENGILQARLSENTESEAEAIALIQKITGKKPD